MQEIFGIDTCDDFSRFITFNNYDLFPKSHD